MQRLRECCFADRVASPAAERSHALEQRTEFQAPRFELRIESRRIDAFRATVTDADVARRSLRHRARPHRACREMQRPLGRGLTATEDFQTELAPAVAASDELH